MCWNFSTKNHPNTPPTTPNTLFWYINFGIPKRNFENETMLSYRTQIFSSNYQMLGIPSATNVIFHTILKAHFAMHIGRSHTDQLPVNHLGIPDPSFNTLWRRSWWWQYQQWIILIESQVVVWNYLEDSTYVKVTDQSNIAMFWVKKLISQPTVPAEPPFFEQIILTH